MKIAKIHSTLILLIAISLTAIAQEKKYNIDFGFPKNTEQAMELTGYYDGSSQQFKPSKTEEFHFNSLGLITLLKYPITPTIVNQEKYTYDVNQNLIQVDYLLGTLAGASESKSTISIIVEDNRTTLMRTEPNGDVLKALEFRNDEGELRGKSFFDKNGIKVKYIEFGGKEGYNIKEYKNNVLVSNIIYHKNDLGKIEKTIEFTEPNLKVSKEKLTTFEYNSKGDLIKTIEYHAAPPNEKPVVRNTKITEYLYKKDVWVASASYDYWKFSYQNTILATIRNIKNSKTVYSAKDEQQVQGFFKQAYQNYLNAKIE